MRTTLTTVCLVAVSFVGSVTQSGDAQRLSDSASSYQRMLPIANAWKAAAQRADVERLVAFTWPEYRDSASSQMRKSSSPLYLALISPSGPLQRLLMKPQIRLQIFEESMGSSNVKNYAVCLDAAPKATELKLSFLAITEIRRVDVFCTYWVAEPEGTFVSYTFGLPD